MSRLIAVGLSGGIDSAVTAALLQDRGEKLVGVTMALGRENEEKSLADTRLIADKLGIPLEIIDLSQEWQNNVVSYIRSSYLGGNTPNPCVKCNETVKFSLLPRFAFEKLGADLFATGHYARIEDGKLLRGIDRAKDQSYFLYRVAPEIISRTIFPLGAMTKDEVRKIAVSRGLVLENRGESQDFCGGDTLAIVGEADRIGEVITVDGKVIGHHRGFWHYTIGKRKGLGIGGGIPYYVVALNAEKNQVIVGFKADSVVTEFRVSSLVNSAALVRGEMTVKVRSAGEPKGPAALELLSSDSALVRVPSGISGVAPGQSAVFYLGDTLLGGGIIAGK